MPMRINGVDVFPSSVEPSYNEPNVIQESADGTPTLLVRSSTIKKRYSLTWNAIPLADVQGVLALLDTVAAFPFRDDMDDLRYVFLVPKSVTYPVAFVDATGAPYYNLSFELLET